MEQTLAQKLEAFNTAKQAVLNHPMCQSFQESAHHFLVMLPNNVRGIDAVRVAKNNQKTKALGTMLNKLEKMWRLDNPVLYPEEQP